MTFNVRFVDETDLPTEQPWVIGVTHRGERFLFIKRSAVTPAMFEQAWEAGRALSVAPSARRHAEDDDLRVAI